MGKANTSIENADLTAENIFLNFLIAMDNNLKTISY